MRRFAGLMIAATLWLLGPSATAGEDQKDAADSAQVLEKAAELRKKGHVLDALALLQKALEARQTRLGDESPELLEILDSLGELYVKAGDPARGEALFGRAVTIRERMLGTDHADVATGYEMLGKAAHLQGAYARAETMLLRALAIRTTLLGPNDPSLARLFSALGNVQISLGNHAQAKRSYALSCAMYEASGNTRALFIDLSFLAAVNEFLGDVDEFRSTYGRAFAVLEKMLGPGDVPLPLARELAMYSVVLTDTPDLPRAERILRRLLDPIEKALGPNSPEAGELIGSLGKAYANAHDPARAEPNLARALTICETSRGPSSLKCLLLRMHLAQLQVEKKEDARAAEMLERALELAQNKLDPEKDHVGTILHSLAKVHWRMGQMQRAEPSFDKATRILSAALGPNHPQVADVIFDFALFRLEQGQSEQALELAATGIKVLDRHAQIMLPAGTEAQKRKYMSKAAWGADVVLSLQAKATDAEPAARLALETILMRKGWVLELMASGFSHLRAQNEGDSRALFDELGSLYSRLSALVLRGPGREGREAYLQQLAQLEVRCGELEARVSRQNPAFARERRAVKLAEIAAALPRDAALVEIALYRPHCPRSGTQRCFEEPRYVAYVLHPDGAIGHVDLGAAAVVDAAVADLRQGLLRPTHDAKKPGRALDQRVFEPIVALLRGARRIYLSPDGALSLVPFGALVNPAGKFRLEEMSFTYLTSGRELLRHGLKIPAREPALVLAAPDFGTKDKASPTVQHGLRSVDFSAIVFSPLPGSASEARAIARQVSGARLMLGKAATESVLKAARGPKMLHIASHGFFLPDADFSLRPAADAPAEERFVRVENPLLRAGISFEGANRGESGEEDGVLTALEASTLDLSGTRLVVLSACQTGVGEINRGEGVLGMRRAFVVAGAETLALSLWNVDDEATRRLMVGYYGRLATKSGRSEAMRQSALALLADEDTAHPFYWASFIVSGNDAALDGPAMVADSTQVARGPRGCACSIVPADDASIPAAALLGLACAMSARRKTASVKIVLRRRDMSAS